MRRYFKLSELCETLGVKRAESVRQKLENHNIHYNKNTRPHRIDVRFFGLIAERLL